MVSDDAEHRFPIVLEGCERPELRGHLGRGRVTLAAHDRRNCPADRPSLVGVVGDAQPHQQRTDVGESQPEGPVEIAQFGDPPRGERGHQNGDLENDRPQTNGVPETLDIEGAVTTEECDQVERRQIAGGIVEEHVLRARVGGVDPSAGGTGVPLVDRVVELQTRIGAFPRRHGDVVPQPGRGDFLDRLTVRPPGQVPVPPGIQGPEECVGNPDAVVGILTGDGEVGLRVPVGVVFLDVVIPDTLSCQFQDPLNRTVGNAHAAGGSHGQTEFGVGFEIGVRRVAPIGEAGVHDIAEVPLQYP